MAGKKTAHGLVPKLRFPEFRDAGAWQDDSFDALVEVIDGDRGKNYPKAKEFSHSGYCVFLNAKNVTKSGFKFKDIQFITKEKDAVLRKGKLQRADLVLTTRGSVGQFAYYSKNVSYDNLRINSGMVLLRIKPEFRKTNKINSDYLYKFSKSPVLTAHIKNIAFGNAQQQLTVAIIKKFRLHYPKPPEQKKIADCLTSIDELITAQAKKLDILKAHKKGLMQQLFPAEGETVPKLRFPEFRDAGAWEEKELKLVCQMQAGKFVSASKIYAKPEDGLYPCYGGNGLRGFTKTYTHTGKYSLIGRQGALCGNITLAEGDFHATEHAVVTTPKSVTNAEWLYYELLNLNLNQYATGQAQPGLSVKSLEGLMVTIPIDEREQQKIANCLTSIDNLITAQAKKLNTLKNHKKGLMQQLFPATDEVNG